MQNKREEWRAACISNTISDLRHHQTTRCPCDEQSETNQPMLSAGRRICHGSLFPEPFGLSCLNLSAFLRRMPCLFAIKAVIITASSRAIKSCEHRIRGRSTHRRLVRLGNCMQTIENTSSLFRSRPLRTPQLRVK